MWPFTKPEARQAGGFTNQVAAAIEADAAGLADAGATAAIEAAAGAVSRAFASAEVEGTRAELVTPDVLALIGRDLIRCGESVHLIEVGRDGRAMLRPVGAWDVQGGGDPATWLYRCDVFGPTGNTTRLAPGASVVHCRYSVDPSRPWAGVGPLTRARLTAKLAGAIEAALADEAGGARGNLLPVPSAGTAEDPDNPDDDFLAKLRAQLAALKGKTLAIETTAGGFGDGADSAPRRDWRAERLGANPPASMVTLDNDAAQQILGACGVPPGLFRANADGTSQRESWRRFLHGTIGPLAKSVQSELRAKLDSSALAITFDALFASDLAGRARAFQSLVGGGMDISAAASLAGLMAEDS